MGRELFERGEEVEIFCLQITPDEPLQDSIEEIPLHRYPYSMLRLPHKRLKDQVERVREAIPPYLNRFQPDAVWCRSAAMGLGISHSGYKGKLVQIFSTTASLDSRGTFLQTQGAGLGYRLKMAALYPLAYRAMRRIEKALLPRCRPVVLSEVMRNQLVREYGPSAQGTKVIPPGVDSHIFSPISSISDDNDRIRSYSLSTEERFVLYVGRLSPAKNLPVLFHAMKRLRNQETRLVLVGEGRLEDRLRGLADRLGLGARVLFVGKQSDLLPAFYRSAAVSVLPTTIESFGQVYLESMACGTPVVGFGGNPRFQTATDEIVADRETGRVVADFDAGALAEAMDWILELPPEKYREMSARCVEKTVAKYNWKRFVESVLALG
jgi:glycosyltransferase involved in cell wall biosynthesis